MADIVLTTLNARYWHSAFGLRYLLANLGDLGGRAALLEFTINDSLPDVLAAIVEQQPRIVGVGVYIWNVEPVTRLIADLKRVQPDTCVVVGGPEVSHEPEEQRIVALADHVITGEGDLAFAELCRDLLAGSVPQKIIAAPLPDPGQLQLPYSFYTEEDIAHRVLYVEASRGCPFTCEFCLSALDVPVRQIGLARFLGAMQELLDRGARQFKFVDRTFNLNVQSSRAILKFFLERYEPGLFLHFEMIPDRLPEALRDLIVRFPENALQFEIGVQTFNPEVGQRISRKQDIGQLVDNFRFLRQHSGVHIHADLIAGLPGESLESFAAGFDRLAALRPQEIQVGLLKRLRGTPITRHDETWGMTYSAAPPYEILSTRLIDFPTMQRLRRFARVWDLIGNSGNFQEAVALLVETSDSVFAAVSALADRIAASEQRTHGIPLVRLAEHVFRFLIDDLSVSPQRAAEILWRDYTRTGRRDRPVFLRAFDLPAPKKPARQQMTGPPRQTRHLRLDSRDT